MFLDFVHMIHICEFDELSTKAWNQTAVTKTCSTTGYKVWSLSTDDRL